jgi:hypothetical protein
MLATFKNRKSELSNWFAPEQKIRAKTEPGHDGGIDQLLHHHEELHRRSTWPQRGINVATIGFGGDL